MLKEFLMAAAPQPTMFQDALKRIAELEMILTVQNNEIKQFKKSKNYKNYSASHYNLCNTFV
jgi:hypothetical protein